MDRESPRPLWALTLQQFVYRQLMYLVVIQSVITAVTGARLRWHKLHRTGQPGLAGPHDRPGEPDLPGRDGRPGRAGPASAQRSRGPA
ncbi:MAG: hypothetical protein QOI74_2453, partial [Micromonosporaceae bacterium]|nr:hypothetical protein [Micromonosporaceae bacterium]